MSFLQNNLVLLGCLINGVAWLFPGTATGAVLAWVAVIALVAVCNCSRLPYRQIFIGSILMNSIGFHWLIYTIREFGNFPLPLAVLIFLLFAAYMSIPMLLFFFLQQKFPEWIQKAGLNAAISIGVIESLPFRIFPWQFGHTQIGFLPFAQLAEFGGVTLISMLMFWASSALIGCIREQRASLARSIPIIVFCLSILYGYFRINIIEHPNDPLIPVTLVQGNISIEEKHNVKFIETNISEYLALSHQASIPGSLIVWPESVVTRWVPDWIRHRSDHPIFSQLPGQQSFLLGAVTYQDKQAYFNSAIAVQSNGLMPEPYHKQILMPFGEYMPFASLFPILKKLNPAVADFTPGREVQLLSFPEINSSKGTLSVMTSPLICYEDMVPALSRKSVVKGATLLANMTNDAWFGDTVAPRQHHQIATFRAIENRRTLLRSTNSGLTAIVDPVGRTIAKIPGFSRGVLSTAVPVLTLRTLYTQYTGTKGFQIFFFFLACILVASGFIFSSQKNSLDQKEL